MINTYTHNDITWIDLESPNKDEIRSIVERYNIHPLVANELLVPTQHPKVDLYGDFVYLVLHFPAISHQHGNRNRQEIDFILSEKLLITTHYDLIDPLHEFSKVFEVSSLLDKSTMGKHAGFIFFFIIRELYKDLARQLDTIEATLHHIESNIFSGREQQMVEKISKMNHDLLTFKQSIRFHKGIWESFEIAGMKLFGNDFFYYLRSISGEDYKIASILEGHKDTLLDLRDTNDSLLTTKTNSIMQALTVMAFLVLPPSLVTGLFNMQVPGLPEVGFWQVIMVMGIIVVSLFFIFKWKRWI